MNDTILLLILFYILPAMLSILVICHERFSVTVGEFLIIVIISYIPGINILIGYLGGLVSLVRLKKINNFLNKKIK